MKNGGLPVTPPFVVLRLITSINVAIGENPDTGNGIEHLFIYKRD